LGLTEQEYVDFARRSRPVVAALLLALLWTAESWAPLFVGRTRRVSHNAVNLGLAAINAALAAVLAFGIVAVTEFAGDHHFGLLRMLGLQQGLQWAAALVLFDCWQYWWHRLNHRVRFLWRFHAVHHADAEMDASSGVRFHTGELILSFCARLLVLPLIGMTVSQLVVYEAVSLPVILFHHSNIRLSAGADRSLRWLIVTPWMHAVHHSRWRPETDSNYSSCLSIWDRLFGSFRLRANPQEISLGLDDWEEREWRRLLGLWLAPFRRSPRQPAATHPDIRDSSQP
jgi:sterol desaturase/sphingolipid hydroxylase (fatty acid hydroxylase superfamily)